MSNADFYSQFSSEEEEFYAITLLGKDGRIIWATQTHWVGFTDSQPRKELREPSRVYARVGKVWANLGQSFVVVRSADQMLRFMVSGGNALVEPDLFEVGFKEFLKPEIAIPDGAAGFSHSSFFEDAAFKRVPNPKLRMRILSRDDRRCRICGRRPDDHLDLELHVHHIRPWSRGGVTDAKNLITLCNTCHKGLEPHYDMNLFRYTDDEKLSPNVKKAAEEYAEGVLEYRRIARESEIEE